jgi:hypothetical protein
MSKARGSNSDNGIGNNVLALHAAVLLVVAFVYFQTRSTLRAEVVGGYQRLRFKPTKTGIIQVSLNTSYPLRNTCGD